MKLIKLVRFSGSVFLISRANSLLLYELQEHPVLLQGGLTKHRFSGRVFLISRANSLLLYELQSTKVRQNTGYKLNNIKQDTMQS
jgi:hypothetical protein